jgi:tetratricopeptide (TPR) repeat protein
MKVKEVMADLDIQEYNMGRSKSAMKYLTGIICFLLLSVTLAGQQRIDNKSIEKEHDPGYVYAFTEATKLLLFGDYNRALNLFNECLKCEPNSPAIYYQLAQIYIKAGDINTARVFSRRAYQLNKGNTWYAMQIATVYQASNLPDSAIAIYKTLLNGSRDDLGLLYRIAALYEQEGKYKEALDYLNNIESQAGVSREISVSKSRLYDYMGKEKKAIAELHKSLTGGEEDYIIYGVLAEFFRNHRRPDSASYYYHLSLKDHTDEANILFSYGEFLLEQKKWKEAKELYAGIFSNPQVDEEMKYSYLYHVIQDEKLFNASRVVMDTVAYEIYNNGSDDLRRLSIYSDIKYRLGNYKDAGKALKQIIDKDDKNYSAWEQFLFCKNALGQQDSVKYYGELAVLRFPERPLAYLLLGSALYEKKLYDQAISTLRKGELNAGGDRLKVEFYSMLAECYGKLDNYGMSDEYYTKSLKIDSLNVVILNNYAYSLAQRGERIDMAVSMSRYTIEKEPDNSTYLDTYAWVLFKNARIDEAEKYIRKAIQRGGGNNPEILNHYGDIMAKKGKMKEAVTAWNQALKYGDGELDTDLRLKIQNAGRH